jgi:hypothetical protein
MLKSKIRKFWEMNPVERVKESKKKYNRKLIKKEIKEILREENF